MQVIFLPGIWTVLLSFFMWPLLQFLAAMLCLHLPDSALSPRSFLFRSRGCENGGLIYDRIFRVSKWKHLVPDGNIGAKRKRFKKKHLESFSEENINRFILESARAELSHWLAIFPFWVFGFFVPPEVLWYMLIYALVINLPCIFIQRYNRPRLLRLLERLKSNYRMNGG